NSVLLFEAVGFEKLVIPVGEVQGLGEIILKDSEFLFGENEEVQLAFKKVKRGEVTGAISEINTKIFEEYDNNIWANDILSGRTMGLLGNNNIRGIGIGIDIASLTGSGTRSGNALFVVDGLPREIDYIHAS